MEKLRIQIILLEKEYKLLPYGSIRRERALQKLKYLYMQLHHMYYK